MHFMRCSLRTGKCTVPVLGISQVSSPTFTPGLQTESTPTHLLAELQAPIGLLLCIPGSLPRLILVGSHVLFSCEFQALGAGKQRTVCGLHRLVPKTEYHPQLMPITPPSIDIMSLLQDGDEMKWKQPLWTSLTNR